MEYYFQAKNSNGEMVRGSRTAANERDVVLWLKDLALTPLDIRERKRLIFRDKLLRQGCFSYSGGGRVSLSEKVVFFRNLSFLISSGISLPHALDILLEQCSGSRMRRIIRSVRGNIISGAAFSDAVSDFPMVFEPLSVAFARSGEESGRLADNIAALAALLETRERLRKKITSAMVYPAIVVLVAFSALMVMAAVVLPQFETAFSSLNVPMPPITAFAFKLGRNARIFGYLFPTITALFSFFLFFIRRRAFARLWLDSILLKLPMIGKMLLCAALSRSFATMAGLLDTGVPLSTALDMAGAVSSNARIRSVFGQMKQGAFAGSDLNSVMRESGIFPPMAPQMVRIGEATGRTGAMFKKLAESNEANLEELVKRLTAALEPLMVVFVGAVVAFMALAIFMPVVAAIENFI